MTAPSEKTKPPRLTPVSFVQDAPLTLKVGRDSWSPRNYEDRFEGTVTVRRAPDGYCLAVSGRERCGLARTAGEAWSLLQSSPGLAPAGQAVLAFVTMVLLGLPVGLVTSRKRWGWAGPALAIGGALGMPLLVGLAPTPLLQLAALALGIVAGALAP